MQCPCKTLSGFNILYFLLTVIIKLWSPMNVFTGSEINKSMPLTQAHTVALIHLAVAGLRSWWGVGLTHASRAPHASHCQLLTMNSSKAAQKRRAFFFRPYKPLLRDYFLGVHTPELSTAFSFPVSALPQLLNSKSKAIVATTESPLSFKLGGLGTWNAEQLTYRVTMWIPTHYFCVSTFS